MNSLALLARAPSLGRSKTRLIPRLGEDGARTFAEAALTDLMHIMSAIPSCRRVLFYTPKTAGPGLQSFLEHESLDPFWELQCQPDTPDLGGRLSAALQHIQDVDKSHQTTTSPSITTTPTVTFIGMDCFDLTSEIVSNAMQWASANSGNAYMIPAYDGGYVLLSVPLDCDAETVFSQIEWSSDQTGRMQAQRVMDAGFTCDMAQALQDIDEPTDLDSLWETHESKRSSFPRTMAYLSTVMSEQNTQDAGRDSVGRAALE